MQASMTTISLRRNKSISSFRMQYSNIQQYTAIYNITTTSTAQRLMWCHFDHSVNLSQVEPSQGTPALLCLQTPGLLLLLQALEATQNPLPLVASRQKAAEKHHKQVTKQGMLGRLGKNWESVWKANHGLILP